MKTQEVCKPIGHELGSPIDPELTRPLYKDTHEEIYEVQLGMRGGNSSSIESMGAAAQKFVKEVGCEACKGVLCPVKPLVEQTIRAAEESKQISKLEQMVGSAPDWLKVTRDHAITSLDVDKIKMFESKPYLEQLKDVIGGISNEPIPPQSASELGLTWLKGKFATKIPGVKIMKDGLEANVYNATEAVGFIGRSQVLASERNNLYTKLLGLLTNADDEGKPQVIHPAHRSANRNPGMHATVGQWDDEGVLSEIRMGTKARLYLLTHNPQESEGTFNSSEVPVKVVILGIHGDNEADQHGLLQTIGAE